MNSLVQREVELPIRVFGVSRRCLAPEGPRRWLRHLFRLLELRSRAGSRVWSVRRAARTEAKHQMKTSRFAPRPVLATAKTAELWLPDESPWEAEITQFDKWSARQK